MDFNWTTVVVAVIGIIFGIVARLIAKYAVPWMEEHNLMIAAEIAVNAAEAVWGRYHGDVKLQAALESLARHGYDIDAVEIVEAVKAAWKKLDL